MMIPKNAEIKTAFVPMRKPEPSISNVSPSSIPRTFSPVLCFIIAPEISPMRKNGTLIIRLPVILCDMLRLSVKSAEAAATSPTAISRLMLISSVSKSIKPIVIRTEKKIQVKIELILKSITIKVIISI